MLTASVGRPDAHGLAVQHLPLVKALTVAARRRLPRAFEGEDLFGAGAVGLVEAGQLFDPTCGVTFGQFARTVVQRAIADHVRHGTAANRQHRRDVRAGRPPLVCQDVPVTNARHITDPTATPEDLYRRQEQAVLLRAAVDALPRRYRRVLARCYFRDKPSPPLTSPKASKLHVEALERLRRTLQQRGLTAECFT